MSMNKLEQIFDNSYKGSEIAIIGISGRFPGAKNIEEFWRNLQDGVESISFFAEQEIENSVMDLMTPSDRHLVKAGAVLEDVELFDASFFDFSLREAEIMDPQHRLFLECAWEALESAGYDPEIYKGFIGIYAGTTMSSYLLNNLYPERNVLNSVGTAQIGIGNNIDFLTTTVSYKLNLRGPSCTIQTACSTSLVAVHVACQSLLNLESDMVLAGGVSIRIPQRTGYTFQEGGILSPDGHCRAFDADAQGTIFGNGVGVVLLKRLEDALADGDCIHAVIKGSAINNDGSSKVGFTAPRVDGQAEVIVEALANAEVEASTITYVETHGTGTPLGDPIEIQALTQAFRTSTNKKGFCPIGSVKTNIGHLDAAAGVASLIKTVLALKHKQVPASLNFVKPNLKIDFQNSPFYVNTKLSPWESKEIPRRAGVSSFGIGGTNAHVIVEEAPIIHSCESSRPWQLLVMSAKTNYALETVTSNLCDYLEHHKVNLADVAYTCHVGRKAFNYRRIVACKDREDAVNALKTLSPERVFTALHEPGYRPVVFMFPGQGTQYVNMALELYQTESVFRQQVDACTEYLKPHLDIVITDVLFPSRERVQEAIQQLDRTLIAQPALFVIEYALAKLWMEWGIHPQAMLGHSIGEYVAACIAGVFSLEDALSLIAVRGKLLQRLPAGAMLAVQLPENRMQSLLGKGLCLAAVNGPSHCVVSGLTDAVDELEQKLIQEGVICRRLHTCHAFHSEMVEPILAPFTDEVKKIRLRAPQIPYISNVTGTWITAEEATDVNYWARHLRQTVRFAHGIEQLLKEQQNHILVEVGPGRTLSTLARQQAGKTTEHIIIEPSLRHPQEQCSDTAHLLNTLGKLWLAGVQVDWAKYYDKEQRRRVTLPTYPFERQRCWIEAQTIVNENHSNTTKVSKKPNIDNWFYIPSWKRSILPVELESEILEDQNGCWLIFIDEYGLGEQITERLEQEDRDVVIVTLGEQFGMDSDGVYKINPRLQDDYESLMRELQALGKIPQRIVHLWNLTEKNHKKLEIELHEEIIELSFYSLLYLAQAIGQANYIVPIQIWVISSNLHDVTGTEVLCPEKAMLLGPCKVIPQEYSNITCRSIDVVIPKAGSVQSTNLVDILLAEFKVNSPDLVIAYRQHHRWVQSFESIQAKPVAKTTLLNKGVYLIIGGLGRFGLIIAEHLAQTLQAKLVLTTRSQLPSRDGWEQWLADHNENDSVSLKIKNVKALEELGAEVLVIRADVADQEQMQEVISETCKRFGDINGVIHAAGIVDRKETHRAIDETNRSECEQILRSKVKGLIVLEKVLQGRELDFCLLTSSLSPILGGLGFVAYSAANLFLDTFAHYIRKVKQLPWRSINWEGWYPHKNQEDVHGLGAQIAQLIMTDDEVIESFQRVLPMKNATQVVIATGDILSRINQWVKLESVEDTKYSKHEVSSPVHNLPKLQNNFVAPRDEIERVIADICRSLLAVEEIGVYDSFFNLGGNSLLAVQFIARLRETFQQYIPLRTLFEKPTILGIAEVIRKKQFEEDQARIAQILTQIENLDEDEIQKRLAEELQTSWEN